MQSFKLEFEKEFPKLIMRKYTNGMIYYFIKPNVHVEMPDVLDVLEVVHSFGTDKKYLNLYEFAENSDTDPEVREWASDSSGNNQTIADAFVIQSLAHKIIMNFYIKFNKPVKPTRIFTRREEAANWLLKFTP